MKHNSELKSIEYSILSAHQRAEFVLANLRHDIGDKTIAKIAENNLKRDYKNLKNWYVEEKIRLIHEIIKYQKSGQSHTLRVFSQRKKRG